MTFKNSELRNIISKINLEDILLETDRPNLSPEPYRGKINNPSNLIFIGKKLSQINSLPMDLVCQVTSQNAINLFDLPGNNLLKTKGYKTQSLIEFPGH